jgi:hypothetical protein
MTEGESSNRPRKIAGYREALIHRSALLEWALYYEVLKTLIAVATSLDGDTSQCITVRVGSHMEKVSVLSIADGSDRT